MTAETSLPLSGMRVLDLATGRVLVDRVVFEVAAPEKRNALNSYAADGWRIAGGISAMSIWKSAKSEILVFLERDRQTPGQ